MSHPWTDMQGGRRRETANRVPGGNTQRLRSNSKCRKKKHSPFLQSHFLLCFIKTQLLDSEHHHSNATVRF